MRGDALKSGKKLDEETGRNQIIIPSQTSSRPNRELAPPNGGDCKGISPQNARTKIEVFRIFSHLPRFSTTQIDPQNDRKTQVFF